uniref:LTI65/LTI78 PGEED repeat domain-containing protein n=1 Tax=Oryza meridionalis TaxID=40149 RepID=A0A0E0E1E0_9ORYZ
MTVEVAGRNSGDCASGSSNSSNSDEDGYQEDIEDKPIAMDYDPEVHGVPMYDMVRTLAVQEVEPWRVTARCVKVSARLGHIGTTPVIDSFEWKDAATDTTPEGGVATSSVTYTDKIKLAATCSMEYGKKLATTMYKKVTGVKTVVAGKVQQVTQSAGTAISGIGGTSQSQGTAQDMDASTTLASDELVTGQQQDKGATVTGYIADMLCRGYEDCVLSEAICGTVQWRKEVVA